ncbi:MAG: heavy-metal-associated domain-containing protein [Alphaproteobacteria bacterium]
MKKTLIFAFVMAMSLATMAPMALAAGPQYELHVAGLACPFCAYGIEKKLSQIEGVETVETDIASETVTVAMKDGQSLDRTAAERAVKAAGFDLLGMEKAQTNTK